MKPMDQTSEQLRQILRSSPVSNENHLFVSQRLKPVPHLLLPPGGASALVLLRSEAAGWRFEEEARFSLSSWGGVMKVGGS